MKLTFKVLNIPLTGVQGCDMSRNGQGENYYMQRKRQGILRKSEGKLKMNSTDLFVSKTERNL